MITLHTVWIKRAFNDDDDLPELITAWDDLSVDENREGWEEHVKKELEKVGKDLKEVRHIRIEVPTEKIKEVFSSVVPGKVQ